MIWMIGMVFLVYISPVYPDYATGCTKLGDYIFCHKKDRIEEVEEILKPYIISSTLFFENLNREIGKD